MVIPSDQQPAQVLAHSEPFSLLYKCWMTTRGELLTTGTPDYLFRTAATKGIKRAESGFANLFGAGTVPGKSSTAPVLTGADEVQVRDDAWAKLLLTI